MSSNQKCSNDIYSELNFEKQRDQNLKRTQELYQGIFSEYSQLYADYIGTQQAVLANPNNMEARNKSDASRTQKKPNIIKLNKKLVDIETELLNNNNKTRDSIHKQQEELKKDNDDIIKINKKIDHLEKTIRKAEDNTETGKHSVSDIQEQYHRLTFWYYVFIVLSILFFIIFVILFTMTLSSTD